MILKVINETRDDNAGPFSKDFGELDNKLIIEYFHHIHIHTMTYTMYS